MHPAADTRLRGLAGPTVLAGAPDERLVALVRAGEERAFDEIVKRYRAPLLRYVLRYLPPAAAEDALQQAFINAYTALTSETAKVPVSLRPWMYRVAHNAALNVGRDPQAAFVPLPEGLDGVERPEEALQRSERLWNVVRALRALPERQRQVIVRHALDGDSHEQIAADLGVSTGAIRQLVHRARRSLRETAAALIPVPVLRWLGSGLAESAPALRGGGTAARVAAAAVATAVAGGGAVEVATKDRRREPARAGVTAHVQPAAPKRAAAGRDPVPVIALAAPRPSRPAPAAAVPAERDRSGSGPSGGSAGDGSSSGTSGSGTSGSSGSGSSGSGSSGDDTSGSSGSSSSGSGSSGDETGGRSGSGSSGSDSSDSGSSGSGSSGSGSSGDGASGGELEPVSSSGSGSSGSDGSDSGHETALDSSGSGSSDSGSGDG